MNIFYLAAIFASFVMLACIRHGGEIEKVTSAPTFSEHPFDSLRASCPTEIIQYSSGGSTCVTCDSGGRWEVHLFPRTNSNVTVHQDKLLTRDASYIVTNYDMWMLELTYKPFERRPDNNEEDSKEELDMPFLSRAYYWQDSAWTQVSTAVISNIDDYHCYVTKITHGRYHMRQWCDTVNNR